MPSADLERRVRILEEKVAGLQEIPARLTAVESQIVHLRDEMHSGFSAMRAEMVRVNDETRTEMVRLTDETRAEMVRLNDETRREMRLLHEDVIARIALMHEGLSAASPGRSRQRGPKQRRKP